MKLVLAILAPLLAMTLLSAGSARVGTTRAVAGFQHAYAYPDCAPWDGGAIAIILQDKPMPPIVSGHLPPERYPRYIVRLWSRHPRVDQWIELPARTSDSTNSGAISDCPADGACKSLAGRIKLTRFTAERIEGELRLPLPDATGRELVFPFSAPFLPLQVFCG